MKNKIPQKITIGNVEYVRADSTPTTAYDTNGLQYTVIRSRDSGCWAGYLESHDGDQVELVNARRLWYWDGAATLSQLAMEGVKRPKNCKFPMPVAKVTIVGVCEIISATEMARSSIAEVEEWKE